MRHYSISYINNLALRHIYRAIKLRPSSYPYISGDSIRPIATHYFENKKTFNPLDVRNHDVIFVESGNVKRFFIDIEPKIKAFYILISHNGDANITGEYQPFLASKHLIHWFAQNCLISNVKISPLPIGLENKWFHLHGMPKYFDLLRSKEVEKKTAMLYKFSLATNPLERGLCLDALRKHPLAETYSDWRLPIKYLKTLQGYKFVVSPPGNGVDCIRTWEAMYLKTIPIVKNDMMTKYFYECGLPLLLIDDWQDLALLSESDLNKLYDTIKPRFSCDALWVEYWTHKISSKIQ